MISAACSDTYLIERGIEQMRLPTGAAIMASRSRHQLPA